MNSPFFSIVIPTRNRTQTLEFSVQTILNQNFQNFEVIISDNSSDNETSELINKLTDKRVFYHQTNGQLSMVDNWETALCFVKGKYVIYVGDDDGLLLNALSIVYETLSRKNVDILHFDWVSYNWPNQAAVSVNPNQVQLKNSFHKEGFIDSKQIMNSVLNSQLTYYVLPTIYTSFFSIDFIKARMLKNGRFFNSIIPDVYSGVLSCFFSENIYKINKFLGIRGTSFYSNGVAFSNRNENNRLLADEFKVLNSLSECAWNSQIPSIVSNYVFPVESYFQLCEIYKITISKKDLFKYYIKIIRRAYFDYRHDKTKVITDLLIIKEVINKNRNLPKVLRFLLNSYIKKLEQDKNYNIKPPEKIAAPEYGYNRDALTINASNYGVKNILEAQVFLDKLLN